MKTMRDKDGLRWFRVDLVKLTDRVSESMNPRRRWSWVKYTAPGHASRLALLTPLSRRVGLLDFRMRRGGWVRPIAKKAAAAETKEAA